MTQLWLSEPKKEGEGRDERRKIGQEEKNGSKILIFNAYEVLSIKKEKSLFVD